MCEILTIPFEEMIKVNIRKTSRPVSVNDLIDRQETTAFIAVKLKIPSAAFAYRTDSNVSLVGDSKSGIVVQLVEKTFLK